MAWLPFKQIGSAHGVELSIENLNAFTFPISLAGITGSVMHESLKMHKNTPEINEPRNLNFFRNIFWL